MCYHKIKGFYVQIDGTNFEDGAKSLMQTVGLGKLKPNIIMLGYKNNWFKCSAQDLNMYFNVLQYVCLQIEWFNGNILNKCFIFQ